MSTTTEPIYGPTPATLRDVRRAVIRETNPAEAQAWRHRDGLQRIDATREQLDEARDWASDCAWREDPEEIAEMTDEQVIAGVERNYDGGWHELVRNAGLEDRIDQERG